MDKVLLPRPDQSPQHSDRKENGVPQLIDQAPAQHDVAIPEVEHYDKGLVPNKVADKVSQINEDDSRAIDMIKLSGLADDKEKQEEALDMDEKELDGADHGDAGQKLKGDKLK